MLVLICYDYCFANIAIITNTAPNADNVLRAPFSWVWVCPNKHTAIVWMGERQSTSQSHGAFRIVMMVWGNLSRRPPVCRDHCRLLHGLPQWYILTHLCIRTTCLQKPPLLGPLNGCYGQNTLFPIPYTLYPIHYTLYPIPYISGFYWFQSSQDQQLPGCVIVTRLNMSQLSWLLKYVLFNPYGRVFRLISITQ
jgi:hypothetical protein